MEFLLRPTPLMAYYTEEINLWGTISALMLLGFVGGLTDEHNALRWLLALLMRTTSIVAKKPTRFELRLRSLVPIRTGLGTRRNTGECILGVSDLWNLQVVVIGTW